MDEPRRETREKYDRLAATYSGRYANPAAIAERQVQLAARWGRPMASGASVLEAGCADGFVTEQLARAGFRVTALDISPKMIEVTRERLSRAGLTADLVVADLQTFSPARTFDVALILMGDFFHYVDEPEAVIRRLGAATAGKLLVDLNPRTTDLRHARTAVADAGFDVTWRPMFVPQTRRVGPGSLAALRLAERVVGLRGLILHRQSKVVVKGERR